MAFGAGSKQAVSCSEHTFDAAAGKKGADSAARAWSVEDSVRVRYFMDAQSRDPTFDASKGQPIVWAPDAQHFLFVTRRGDLECDCNVYEMRVFSSKAVEAALVGARQREFIVPPMHLVTMRSTSSDQRAIDDARWLEDGSAIVFRGNEQATDGDVFQIYRLRLRDGALERLTHAATDVIKYHIRGDSLVYTTAETTPSRALTQYPAAAVEGFEFLNALLSAPDYSNKVFASYRGQPVRQIGSVWAAGPTIGPKISPDGRRAIAGLRATHIPDKWSAYDGLDSTNAVRRHANPELPLWAFPQLMLIELETGKVQSLLGAPTGAATSAGQPVGRQQLRTDILWFSNSRRAILINTALPLVPEADERRRMAYIVDYEIDSGRWTVLEPVLQSSANSESTPSTRVASVRWLVPDRELLITHVTSDGRPAGGIVRSLRGSTWTKRTVTVVPDADPPARPALSVHVRESANEPPTAVASNGCRELALTPPDPALSNVWWAQSEVLEWQEGTRVARALLKLPRDLRGATPLPLVIHAYRFQPDLFRPDGSQPSAYAAQALVSAGMAVVEIDIPAVDRPESTNTPREGALFVDRIDRVVELLKARGLIDPDRVGVIGFSRGGYMVLHALSHPGKTKLAAAVSADSWTGSYSSYLLAVATGVTGSIRNFEKLYGGTFWENPSDWLEREVIFNANRVETPLLYMAHGGPRNAVYLIDILAAFRVNQRPLEMMFFQGGHRLVRPRERVASMQASVDWMVFWLQGREQDRRPVTDNRYERWRALREQARSLQARKDLPMIWPSTAAQPAR